MHRHQLIQLLHCRAMDMATPFPCKNFFSQFLPKPSHGFQGAPRGNRFSLKLKVRHLTSAQQPSCLKPPQERAEVREQLSGLAVLNRTRVQAIQSQMVADEEEPVSPVGIRDCPALFHIPVSSITPIMYLFSG